MNFAPSERDYTIHANGNTYVLFTFMSTPYESGLHARTIRPNGDNYWGRTNLEAAGGLLTDQYGQRLALYMGNQ